MKVPDYRYVDEITEGNVPIEIPDGHYKGIVLRYDRVVLEEKDENLHFDYDYDIIENPNKEEVTEELRDVFTNILLSVLEEQITDVPEDLDILKEVSSEEHRVSDTSKSNIQRGVLSEGGSLSKEGVLPRSNRKTRFQYNPRLYIYIQCASHQGSDCY